MDSLAFNGGTDYQIVDVAGRIVSKGQLLASSYSSNEVEYKNINVQNLRQGIYWVKIIGENGVQAAKLMKR